MNEKRIWFFCFLVWSCIFAVLYLAGCASDEIFERGDFTHQILRARVGYAGLTNSKCLAHQDGDSTKPCIKWDIVAYNLEDEGIRKQLRQAAIICKLGEVRYQVCQDKPGLCHRERHCEVWVFGCKMTEDYVAQAETQRLVLGGLRCFDENTFDYNKM